MTNPNTVCDTCKNKDICKYKDDVMKQVNHIGVGSDIHYPLEITFSCKHYAGHSSTLIRGGNLNGGNPISVDSNLC